MPGIQFTFTFDNGLALSDDPAIDCDITIGIDKSAVHITIDQNVTGCLYGKTVFHISTNLHTSGEINISSAITHITADPMEILDGHFSPDQTRLAVNIRG